MICCEIGRFGTTFSIRYGVSLWCGDDLGLMYRAQFWSIQSRAKLELRLVVGLEETVCYRTLCVSWPTVARFFGHHLLIMHIPYIQIWFPDRVIYFTPGVRRRNCSSWGVVAKTIYARTTSFPAATAICGVLYSTLLSWDIVASPRMSGFLNGPNHCESPNQRPTLTASPSAAEPSSNILRRWIQMHRFCTWALVGFLRSFRHKRKFL